MKKREKKWFEEVLRYLFRITREITKYRSEHTTPKGGVSAEGKRIVTSLMQVKYPEYGFQVGSVGQILAFVTCMQNRSNLGKSHQNMFDRAMIAAEEENFISIEEYVERMTS